MVGLFFTSNCHRGLSPLRYTIQQIRFIVNEIAERAAAKLKNKQTNKQENVIDFFFTRWSLTSTLHQLLANWNRMML